MEWINGKEYIDRERVIWVAKYDDRHDKAVWNKEAGFGYWRNGEGLFPLQLAEVNNKQ